MNMESRILELSLTAIEKISISEKIVKEQKSVILTYIWSFLEPKSNPI
jgi:hypothetical protein